MTLKSFIVLIWTELITWIKGNFSSIAEFVVRVFIGMFIYVIIDDLLTRAITAIEEKLKERGSDNKIIHALLNLLKLFVMINVIFTMSKQLYLLKMDSLFMFLASSGIAILLVIHGVLTKLITDAFTAIMRALNDDDTIIYSSTVVKKPRFSHKTTKTIRRIVSFIHRFLGGALAIALVFLIYQGVIYTTSSGGTEISLFLDLPERNLEEKLDTRFFADNEMNYKIPVVQGEKITVRSDGDLNLIYMGEQLIGFNTTSRKYKIYNVAINQSEASALKKFTYLHDGSTEDIQDLNLGYSMSHIYYDTENNTCLIMTVNDTSNRVVSLSYFNDYKAIEEMIAEQN